MTNASSLLFLILFCSTLSYAQTILVGSDQGPVSNASVVVTSIAGDSQFFHVSDQKGEVHTSIKPPFQIVTSHVNFQTRKDTVTQEGRHQIMLSEKEHRLDEVVITGQLMPQSVQKSVYNVRVLDKERLTAQGIQSLPEVLAYELNFQFQRDNATGSSSTSLQGISGQNIKILLDGVPIVGRSGINNEIDLSQINLAAIEKIEIIEGPMAVNYGADALAGVVNIITTQPDSSKISFDIRMHEASVGREYRLINEGIHNLSLNGNYRFSPSWTLQSESRVYRFGGWSGIGRDKLWYPKDQFFQSGALKYEQSDFNIYYRFDYLNEKLFNHGSAEQTNPQEDPYAFDKNYLTSRWMHQVQAELPVGQGAAHTVLSYTQFKRRTHRFKSYLVDGVPDFTTPEGQDTVAFNTVFFRHTLNDAAQWSIGDSEWHTQVGLEGTFEKASGSTLNDGEKQMSDLSLFASIEIILQRLKIRPGLRLAYNNTFSTRPTASINLKYDFSTDAQLRLSYGQGFRAPSLRELYHEFIDANHNVIGNSELEPEYSKNVNGDFTYRLRKKWRITVAGFFNSINNRIGYFTPDNPNEATTYMNVSNFRTHGYTSGVTYEHGSIMARTGFSYVGRYHNFSEQTSLHDVPKYLYAPEVTSALQLDLFKTGISLASFYKYTGPGKQYINVTQDDGTSELQLQQRMGFHLWDLTLSGGITPGLTVSLGVKNLLDVTAVTNIQTSGNAHSSSSNGQSSVAYGRSYFFNINYKFSK
ncbi:MAG: TonB-dependent receptor [Reichenbachiella sp.]|uniref:TonB-dependent receptor plug domain-containing protein n=1 Tax=Reichenbachiella sp. TaxID=2184521 RepID=UPI003267D31C